MAQAKAPESQIDQRAMAEAARQIIKQNEWVVKLKDILEAAIQAEQDLPKKKAALDEADKALVEKQKANLAATQSMVQEAQVKKTDLEKQFAQRKGQLQGELTRGENQKKKLYDDIAGLITELEKIKKEKAELQVSFDNAKAQAASEIDAVKASHQKEKNEMEAELEVLRQAVRAIKGGIQRLPEVAN